MNRPHPVVGWASRREVGSITLLRFAVWLARALGRPLSRALLPPVCLGFMILRADARAASRGYLMRVLGRPPGLLDVLRHFFTFGSTVLDRVYLLDDNARRFQITIHGQDILNEALEQGHGCLLLGAHHGSFEVLRLAGRNHPGLRVSLAMYEATGRKIGAVLNAINPRMAPRIIGLGRPGAMLEIRDSLEQGEVVGMLADRTLPGDTAVRVDFLGAPAAFPAGPARLAGLLRPQVILMVGLFRGGNRYEIHFERLAAPGQTAPGQTAPGQTAPGQTAPGQAARGQAAPGQATLERWQPEDTSRLIALYVARLEHYCRAAPYNWFNFYDFWAA